MNLGKCVYFGLIILWAALCISVLVMFLVDDSAWQLSETAELLFLRMVILTFPLGITAVTIGMIGIDALASIGLDLGAFFPAKVETIFVWAILTVFGFFQWFIIVPKIFTWGYGKWNASDT